MCVLLWVALGAHPAAADWLVTRQGDRIETAGGWAVEGKLVVFELPNGQLASLRASEVDLEASAALTRAAAEAAERPPRSAAELEEPPAAARFVLTDDDVAHVPPGWRPAYREYVEDARPREVSQIEVHTPAQ